MESGRRRGREGEGGTQEDGGQVEFQNDKNLKLN